MRIRRFQPRDGQGTGPGHKFEFFEIFFGCFSNMRSSQGLLILTISMQKGLRCKINYVFHVGWDKNRHLRWSLGDGAQCVFYDYAFSQASENAQSCVTA